MEEEYTIKTIKNFYKLKPGDHICIPSEVGKLISKRIGSAALEPHISHHLMVVQVIDKNAIQVIHKTEDGVIEERKHYKAEDIRVLVYKSKYTGQVAVQNARKLTEEKYDLKISNDEHFVFEARTGMKAKTGEPVAKDVVGSALKGAAVGAIAGSCIGSIVPGPGTFVGFIAGAWVGGVLGVRSTAKRTFENVHT